MFVSNSQRNLSSSSPSPGDCALGLGPRRLLPSHQRPSPRLQHLSWTDPIMHRILSIWIQRSANGSLAKGLRFRREELDVPPPYDDRKAGGSPGTGSRRGQGGLAYTGPPGSGPRFARGGNHVCLLTTVAFWYGWTCQVFCFGFRFMPLLLQVSRQRAP